MINEHYDNYMQKLGAAIQDLRKEPLEEAAEMIFETWGKYRVYVMGNGGSAAIAEHFVCDLWKWTKVAGSRGIDAVSLVSNMSLLTALANDNGYHQIFLNKIMHHKPKRKDVLVAFSCSGTSANVEHAMDWANGRCKLMLFTGDGNCRLAGIADVGIFVEGIDYRMQEDLFSIAAHAIAGRVKEMIYDDVYNGSDND